MEEYLKETFFLDIDTETVKGFAEKAAGQAETAREKAVRLFYAVRDQIRYDPYRIGFEREDFQAGTVIRKGYGYCVAKAIALCAAARSCGIPARLGFADVRNHLSTPRLRELMNTDLFIFHGYTEMFIEGRWIKATPTFNLSLCERFGVKALDFDGLHEALLHPFDSQGRRHMEYVRDHGSFADVPYDEILEVFRRHYPLLFGKTSPDGDFEKEATAEVKNR